MVLFLRRDVGSHIRRSGGTHSKSAVSSLPGESFMFWKVFVHPPGRIGLHDPQQVRHRLPGSNVHKQVNVICRTINDQRNTLSPADYTSHVREQPGGKLRRQVAITILGGKDDVDQERSEAVGHRLTPRLRGSVYLN